MKISKLDVVAVLVIFLVGLTLAPLPVLSLVVVPVMITVWQGILSKKRWWYVRYA
jgi:hypothetical protein